MDLLTHLFLPIAVVYALRPELFPSLPYFGFAIFAIVPDVDKLLGVTGLFHSALVVLGFAAVLWLVEEAIREDGHEYAALATVLLCSHLVLDILDGGPVPLLAPLVETGFGLVYPTTLVIGDAVTEVAIRDPLPEIRTKVPDRSREAYPLVNGYGVLSVLVFLVLQAGHRLSGTGDRLGGGD